MGDARSNISQYILIYLILVTVSSYNYEEKRKTDVHTMKIISLTTSFNVFCICILYILKPQTCCNSLSAVMLDAENGPTCSGTNFQCFEVEKARKKPLQWKTGALES